MGKQMIFFVKSDKSSSVWVKEGEKIRKEAVSRIRSKWMVRGTGAMRLSSLASLPNKPNGSEWLQLLRRTCFVGLSIVRGLLYRVPPSLTSPQMRICYYLSVDKDNSRNVAGWNKRLPFDKCVSSICVRRAQHQWESHIISIYDKRIRRRTEYFLSSISSSFIVEIVSIDMPVCFSFIRKDSRTYLWLLVHGTRFARGIDRNIYRYIVLDYVQLNSQFIFSKAHHNSLLWIIYYYHTKTIY